MKKQLIWASALMATVLWTSSCTKNEEQEETKSILPSTFSIDVPDAISSGSSSRATQSDTLNGNQIYGNLRGFIHIGEEAGLMVQSIITAISVYQINHAMSLTYTSNEDQRAKNLVVVENQVFEGKTYEFKLSVTDAQSETNADGGKALQVFWNRTSIEGIAILKPYNIDRDENLNQADAIIRVDYSETGNMGYEKHMIVSIANLNNVNMDHFYAKNIKMFVGRTGDIVEVYGNSDHPNANFFTNQTGFDWAFVAASDRTLNIGVAEVGLPSNTLNSTNRTTILVDNAIRTVFSNQIATLGYAQADIDRYLYHTEAPGYFNAGGFVQGETAPNSSYQTIQNKIGSLTPYNPYLISQLNVEFD